MRNPLPLAIIVAAFTAAAVAAQNAPRKDQDAKAVPPVTSEMLVNPSPEDWLMYSRTYDAQRFSPLEFINRRNVGTLKTAWTKELGTGNHEGIPIVYQGVMYVIQPGASVAALDATNGTLLWEYKRDTPLAGRTKTLAIYRDLVYYAAPDGFIVAIDARTGKMRWEAKTDGGMTSGPVVVDGKVIAGRTCAAKRTNCYISAHDALTGTGSLALLHGGGRRRPWRRELGRRTRSQQAGVHLGTARQLRPGVEAALLGRRQPDAEHADGASPGQRQRGPASRRPRICTATRRSRSIPRPASWSGITSTCPATTGTRTTRTSGRCCARPSVRIRSS